MSKSEGLLTKKITQAIDAFVGPLLTLVCTALVVHYIAVGAEPAKAIGAALAGLIGFALALGAEELPKRSRWWRQHFDSRAAFEGWWLQVHDRLDRASVFSFIYNRALDAYEAAGDAFNSSGSHLAHWESTEVFFSTGFKHASYLWKGKSFESEPPEQREGTTEFSVDRGQRWAQPVSGTGQVLHLNLARTLDFRLCRVTPELLKERRLSFNVDDLVKFEHRRELAKAHLAQELRDMAPSGRAQRSTRGGNS